MSEELKAMLRAYFEAPQFQTSRDRTGEARRGSGSRIRRPDPGFEPGLSSGNREPNAKRPRPRTAAQQRHCRRLAKPKSITVKADNKNHVPAAHSQRQQEYRMLYVIIQKHKSVFARQQDEFIAIVEGDFRQREIGVGDVFQ
jgi:hypothetical protein